MPPPLQRRRAEHYVVTSPTWEEYGLDSDKGVRKQFWPFKPSRPERDFMYYTVPQEQRFFLMASTRNDTGYLCGNSRNEQDLCWQKKSGLLSWIARWATAACRHGFEDLRAPQRDSQNWVSLFQLIDLIPHNDKVVVDELICAVHFNPGSRFDLQFMENFPYECPNGTLVPLTGWFIRCRTGHTDFAYAEGFAPKMIPEFTHPRVSIRDVHEHNFPPMLAHATSMERWQKIKTEGLKTRMDPNTPRGTIHMSTEIQTDAFPEASCHFHGHERVWIFIDEVLLLQSNIPVYDPNDGTLVTYTDIPATMFKCVMDKSSGRDLLHEDGRNAHDEFLKHLEHYNRYKNLQRAKRRSMASPVRAAMNLVAPRSARRSVPAEPGADGIGCRPKSSTPHKSRPKTPPPPPVPKATEAAGSSTDSSSAVPAAPVDTIDNKIDLKDGFSLHSMANLFSETVRKQTSKMEEEAAFDAQTNVGRDDIVDSVDQINKFKSVLTSTIEGLAEEITARLVPPTREKKKSRSISLTSIKEENEDDDKPMYPDDEDDDEPVPPAPGAISSGDLTIRSASHAIVRRPHSRTRHDRQRSHSVKRDRDVVEAAQRFYQETDDGLVTDETVSRVLKFAEAPNAHHDLLNQYRTAHNLHKATSVPMSNRRAVSGPPDAVQHNAYARAKEMNDMRSREQVPSASLELERQADDVLLPVPPTDPKQTARDVKITLQMTEYEAICKYPDLKKRWIDWFSTALPGSSPRKDRPSNIYEMHPSTTIGILQLNMGNLDRNPRVPDTDNAKGKPNKNSLPDEYNMMWKMVLLNSAHLYTFQEATTILTNEKRAQAMKDNNLVYAFNSPTTLLYGANKEKVYNKPAELCVAIKGNPDKGTKVTLLREETTLAGTWAIFECEWGEVTEENREYNEKVGVITRNGRARIRVCTFHIDSELAKSPDVAAHFLFTMFTMCQQLRVDFCNGDANQAMWRIMKTQGTGHSNYEHSTYRVCHDAIYEQLNAELEPHQKVLWTAMDNNAEDYYDLGPQSQLGADRCFDCIVCHAYHWGKTAREQRQRQKFNTLMRGRFPAERAEAIRLLEDKEWRWEHVKEFLNDGGTLSQYLDNLIADYYDKDNNPLPDTKGPPGFVCKVDTVALTIERRDLFLGNTDREYHQPLHIWINQPQENNPYKRDQPKRTKDKKRDRRQFRGRSSGPTFDRDGNYQRPTRPRSPTRGPGGASKSRSPIPRRYKAPRRHASATASRSSSVSAGDGDTTMSFDEGRTWYSDQAPISAQTPFPIDPTSTMPTRPTPRPMDFDLNGTVSALAQDLSNTNIGTLTATAASAVAPAVVSEVPFKNPPIHGLYGGGLDAGHRQAYHSRGNSRSPSLAQIPMKSPPDHPAHSKPRVAPESGRTLPKLEGQTGPPLFIPPAVPSKVPPRSPYQPPAHSQKCLPPNLQLGQEKCQPPDLQRGPTPLPPPTPLAKRPWPDDFQEPTEPKRAKLPPPGLSDPLATTAIPTGPRHNTMYQPNSDDFPFVPIGVPKPPSAGPPIPEINVHLVGATAGQEINAMAHRLVERLEQMQGHSSTAYGPPLPDGALTPAAKGAHVFTVRFNPAPAEVTEFAAGNEPRPLMTRSEMDQQQLDQDFEMFNQSVLPEGENIGIPENLEHPVVTQGSAVDTGFYAQGHNLPKVDNYQAWADLYHTGRALDIPRTDAGDYRGSPDLRVPLLMPDPLDDAEFMTDFHNFQDGVCRYHMILCENFRRVECGPMHNRGVFFQYIDTSMRVDAHAPGQYRCLHVKQFLKRLLDLSCYMNSDDATDLVDKATYHHVDQQPVPVICSFLTHLERHHILVHRGLSLKDMRRVETNMYWDMDRETMLKNLGPIVDPSAVPSESAPAVELAPTVQGPCLTTQFHSMKDPDSSSSSASSEGDIVTDTLPVDTSVPVSAGSDKRGRSRSISACDASESPRAKLAKSGHGARPHRVQRMASPEASATMGDKEMYQLDWSHLSSTSAASRGRSIGKRSASARRTQSDDSNDVSLSRQTFQTDLPTRGEEAPGRIQIGSPQETNQNSNPTQVASFSADDVMPDATPADAALMQDILRQSHPEASASGIARRSSSGSSNRTRLAELAGAPPTTVTAVHRGPVTNPHLQKYLVNMTAHNRSESVPADDAHVVSLSDEQLATARPTGVAAPKSFVPAAVGLIMAATAPAADGLTVDEVLGDQIRSLKTPSTHWALDSIDFVVLTLLPTVFMIWGLISMIRCCLGLCNQSSSPGTDDAADAELLQDPPPNPEPELRRRAPRPPSPPPPRDDAPDEVPIPGARPKNMPRPQPAPQGQPGRQYPNEVRPRADPEGHFQIYDRATLSLENPSTEEERRIVESWRRRIRADLENECRLFGFQIGLPGPPNYTSGHFYTVPELAIILMNAQRDQGIMDLHQQGHRPDVDIKTFQSCEKFTHPYLRGLCNDIGIPSSSANKGQLITRMCRYWREEEERYRAAPSLKQIGYIIGLMDRLERRPPNEVFHFKTRASDWLTLGSVCDQRFREKLYVHPNDLEALGPPLERR